MEFIVTELSSKPGTAYVRYDCTCGCKPGAEYARDSSDVGEDRCCCGNMHFVGQAARSHLDEYVSGHAAENADLGGYTVHETNVAAPWGGEIAVAYALPQKPRAH